MKQFLAIFLLCLLLTACHPYEQQPDTPAGNLEALWKIIDEKYCYLDQKGVDWESTRGVYLARVTPDMTSRELFDLCSEMLDLLRDGHVNLSSPFATSFYRRWWSDYPQDFNLRCLQESYLEFDYVTLKSMIYKRMPGDVGYIHISSFASPIGENDLDWILYYFKDCRALVIDIRDNGGGLLTNVERIVGRLITSDLLAGYIRHKTGPGHDDFSEPYPVVYKPAEKGRVMWDKPVVLVTNRSCFSAANDFTSVMRCLPQTIQVGARTGGGAGLPFSATLPNGWSIRFSACPMTDPQGNDIEDGIDPTPGYEAHSPDDELAAGKDAILDLALSVARSL